MCCVFNVRSGYMSCVMLGYIYRVRLGLCVLYGDGLSICCVLVGYMSREVICPVCLM